MAYNPGKKKEDAAFITTSHYENTNSTFASVRVIRIVIGRVIVVLICASVENERENM